MHLARTITLEVIPTQYLPKRRVEAIVLPE